MRGSSDRKPKILVFIWLLPALLLRSAPLLAQSIPKNPQSSGTKEANTQEANTQTDPALEEAARLNIQAIELANKGEFAQALALHQQILKLRLEKLGPADPLVAQSLNNIGYAYHMQGNFTEAVKYYQQALNLWEKAYGPDALALSTSFNNLGYVAQQQGNYQQATELYQQALQIHEKNNDLESADYALALNNLATLYQEQGNFPDALALYQRSQGITEKIYGDESPSAALGLNNMAYLYQSQGDYAAALPLYQKSLAIYEKAYGKEHLDIALVLANLTLLYIDQGNYATALPLAERCLAMRQKFLGLNSADTATSLNNIAFIYQAQGDYARALPIYQQSLEITETVLGPDHPHMATRLNNLAHLYQSQGNYQAALPLYQRSLAIREKAYGPVHALVGQSLNNLSLLYQQLNNYEAAVDYGLRGLEVREKALGPNHPDVAQSLNNLGFLAELLERYDLALPYYQRSIAIREKTLGPNHPSLGITLNNLAYLYYVQKNYAAALPLYQRSLSIIETALGPEHPDVSLSLNNIASLYWANNDVARGLGYLQRAVNIEEQTLTRNLTIGSEAYKRNYLQTFTGSTSRVISYHLFGMPNTAAADLALTTILQRKGRILDVLSNASLNLRRSLSPADAALLDQLSQIRSQIASLTFSPDSPDSSPAKLQALRSQAEQLEGQLSSRSTVFQDETQPVTLAAVQKQIPADAALIEFIQYNVFDPKTGYLAEARYAAYILLAKGGVQWVDLGSAEKIDQQLKAFRQAIANPQDFIPINQTKTIARQTDALIFAPIRAKLGSVSHLLIAPDGELNLIPFAALVDAQNRYLLETYKITYLTSGRDLLRLAHPTPAVTPPLIFADPQYDQPGQPRPGVVFTAERGSNQISRDLAQLSFSPLESTAPEAQAIQGLLPNAQVFMGAAATENQLKQQARPLLLHLATHGFFLRNSLQAPSGDQRNAITPDADSNDLSRNPLLRSGLAMAGFNVRKSGSEDGVLTALEVSGLDLRGTKLVVLSACQTGLGDVASGEGVYGLRRAFTLAGAETQLTSLWYVNDVATKELMINYYQRLQNGEGRSEALRQAQLDFLKNADALQRPYYWAAFVPIGAWGPMSFQK